MSSEREFEQIGEEVVYDGRLFRVLVERYRFPDGEEVTRDVVRHGGAVGIVAHDDESVWLVLQPREAVGDPDLLEIPAGRLDKEGEQPLETAQRELAEEIGKGARHWEPMLDYYSSAGFTDERVHLFLASDLYDESADSGESERIEIVQWPLARLDEAIDSIRDAKTLIGLLWLRRRLGG